MPYVVARMLKRHFLHRVILASLPCLALVGCVPNAVNHIIGDPSQEKIPPNQLADYLATDCTAICPLSGQSTETNPLYWLRAMGCADRMMPVQARSEASAQLTDTWQGAFKRGILLDNARITPPERREAVTRLDALSPQIPSQVRPLYQAWFRNPMPKSACATVSSSSRQTALSIRCVNSNSICSPSSISRPASWRI